MPNGIISLAAVNIMDVTFCLAIMTVVCEFHRYHGRWLTVRLRFADV